MISNWRTPLRQVYGLHICMPCQTFPSWWAYMQLPGSADRLKFISAEYCIGINTDMDSIPAEHHTYVPEDFHILPSREITIMVTSSWYFLRSP